jgi:hypothetical protein
VLKKGSGFHYWQVKDMHLAISQYLIEGLDCLIEAGETLQPKYDEDYIQTYY